MTGLTPTFLACWKNSYEPHLCPWSVIPTAGISSLAVSCSSGLTFAAPSSIEYSVCTWRCTSEAGDRAAAMCDLPPAEPRAAGQGMPRLACGAHVANQDRGKWPARRGRRPHRPGRASCAARAALAWVGCERSLTGHPRRRPDDTPAALIALFSCACCRRKPLAAGRGALTGSGIAPPRRAGGAAKGGRARSRLAATSPLGPQPRHRLRQVGRVAAGELHPVPVTWVAEGEPRRVQPLPVEAEPSGEHGIGAVQPVTHARVPDGLHVD